MKVLVAGATGAIGRELVPKLVARGHDVYGMTHSAGKRDLVARLGATPMVADALDPDQVATVVAEAEPEVIVHQMTAISGDFNPRKMNENFVTTNRLRTEGTDHLLAAGRAVGVRRFVAQSYAPAIYDRSGSMIKDEGDPTDSSPPADFETITKAVLHLESAVTGADGIEGVVLRYGNFYGPGTSIAVNPDGVQIAAVRSRKFPIAGDGGAVWSFIHVEDAAEATVLAVEGGAPGIYNVVDDNPAPVREWVPKVAAAIGAKPPRHVPAWIARLIAGEVGVMMMTELRGSSNAKVKAELGWQPRHPSVWQTLGSGSV